MRKLASVLVVTGMCVGCGGGQAESPEIAAAAESPGAAAAGGHLAGAATAKPAAPAFREVTLPEGTTLQLSLQSAVASDTSRLEDAVRAELREAVVVDGATVIPAGAELSGIVTGVERSGRVQGRARVAYRFDSISNDGETYDVTTAPISHLAPATKGEDATKIAVGAGAGAAIGALLGGGDGAAKGAAIGGAAGTGAVLATRGEEVRLGPGARVSTRLTAPVTVRVAP